MEMGKNDGKNYEYMKVLALCRKPREQTGRTSLTKEMGVVIENIWFNPEFAQNLCKYAKLYRLFCDEMRIRGVLSEDLPSYDSVIRYIKDFRETTDNARVMVQRGMREFKRTSNRHDYALKPYGRTALNALKDAGYDVISVGKIFDIFDGEGLTESNKSKSSVHGMEQTIEISKRDFKGLCFVNLVDFDALWGHRRNVKGYAEELEKFDVKLGELLGELKEDDLLIITADHGNDPTHTGTDHTRENTPVIIFNKNFEIPKRLPNLETFGSIGATIADNFNLTQELGSSFLESLK